MRKATQAKRGFTLIEVIIALAVLLIGGLGAEQAMLMASQNLKGGQVQQIKAALADAHSESLLLANRSLITSAAIGMAPVAPVALPGIGSGPWIIDPTPTSTPQALNSGAFFSGTGVTSVSQVANPGVAATGNCGDSAIPPGTFCREIMVTAGLPTTYAANGWQTAGTNPSWGTVYTLWTRVSQKAANGVDRLPVLTREVIAL